MYHRFPGLLFPKVALAPGDVLEDFETNDTTDPHVSLLTWYDYQPLGGSQSVSRSTSNKTQGTYSWRILCTAVGSGVNGCALLLDPAIDISMYSKIELDFAKVAGPSGANYFGIRMDFLDAVDTYDGSSGASTAASGTLSYNTSDIAAASVDLTQVAILIEAIGLGASPTLDIYIDNLRGIP